MSTTEQQTIDFNIAVSIIQMQIKSMREAGRVNSLDDYESSQRRRETITRHWTRVQAAINALQAEINALPVLPPENQIQWARAVLALRDLAFMEIDTTGLEEADEITRFTLVELSGNILEDVLIKPKERQLSPKASQISGITAEQLEREGVGIVEAWERIQAAICGRYVVSYSQEWDSKQLDKTAQRHRLEPLTLIGECLQRRATKYYHAEYYLDLAKLCARVGHPLPEPPEQTAIHRAIGQAHVLEGFANAITDLTPERPTRQAEASSTGSDEDELLPEDLDAHPF
jgi:DNA polymerase III epsilon subunit-like protein